MASARRREADATTLPRTGDRPESGCTAVGRFVDREKLTTVSYRLTLRSANPRRRHQRFEGAGSHVYTEDGSRKMMVAWLRYLDTFTKIDQAWYIAERKIILEWSETRPLGPPTAG